MTPAQTKMYFREWSAAKRAGHLDEGDRHALHIQALRKDKSSKLFTNAEFDKVLAAFRAISAPADLNAQLRQQNQPRIRLLWAIRHQIKLLGCLVEDPQAYVRTILRERFGETEIEALRAALDGDLDKIGFWGESPLDHARFTITRAVIHLRQRAGLGPSQLEDLAANRTPRAANPSRNSRPAIINVAREMEPASEPF